MPRSIIIAKRQTTDDAVQALPMLLVCKLGMTFYSVYQVGLKPIRLWLSSLKILILSSFPSSLS